MAGNPVSEKQREGIERKIVEIRRRRISSGGYPFDLTDLERHLQGATEGRFSTKPPSRRESIDADPWRARSRRSTSCGGVSLHQVDPCGPLGEGVPRHSTSGPSCAPARSRSTAWSMSAVASDSRCYRSSTGYGSRSTRRSSRRSLALPWQGYIDLPYFEIVSTVGGQASRASMTMARAGALRGWTDDRPDRDGRIGVPGEVALILEFSIFGS